MLRGLVLTLCALSLSACSTIPLTSLPKLARLDVKTLDIGQTAIGVTYPSSFAFKNNEVFLTLSSEFNDGSPPLIEQFIFQLEDGGISPVLARAQSKGMSANIFLPSDAEVARMETLREKLLIADQNDNVDQTSVAVRFHPCFVGEAVDTSLLRPTVYLRTRDDQSFFKFLYKIKITEGRKDFPFDSCDETAEP